MRKIEDGYNKQAITEFLNTKKDAYAKAVECYSRTKDRGCKEEMEEIKYSFSNLNSQLDMYLSDKKSYLKSFEDGQLVDLPGDEKFSDLYTNKGGFSIEDNGDLGFTVGGEYNKYNDVVGKWNVNNNIYDTHILKSSFDSKVNGQNGKIFNRDIQKNSTTAVLKGTGPEGVMTATRSDFGFDDDYILPNGQKAGKMTFESMFTSGLLADKYYDGSITGTVYEKGDNSWFWDKKNSKDLTNLLAEYSTDVNQSMHELGTQDYNARVNKGGKRSGKRIYADRYYGKKGNTVEGNVLENIYQKFNSGVIEVEDGSTWNKDDKTNSWKNSASGEVISGNQMIGMAQDLVGSYSLTNDVNFNKFKGTGGTGGGSTGGGSISTNEIDNIVDNIWQPDRVEGFGEDANGNALMVYLQQNHSDLLRNVEIRSDGEYIYLKKAGDKKFQKWGGDSTGGRSKDKQDITEIFEYLGGSSETSSQVTTFDPEVNMGEQA